MSLEDRLAAFARVAVAVGRGKGYPPALLISQWAIESGWGLRISGKNNYFGMTRAERHGDNWEWVSTREVLSAYGISRLSESERDKITRTEKRDDGKFDVYLSRRFASYPTLTDAVLDKVWLIQSGAPYRAHFAQYRIDNDLNRLVDGIAPIYATDPNYAALVKKIAAQTNVRAAITAAESKSMGKYIATDPTQNATLAQAQKLIKQRALVGLPSLGIVANAQGSQEMVEEADFAAVGINGASPACLLIRIRKGKDAGEDATVPGFGDFINVGETLEALGKAPNLMAGVVSMIHNETNQIGAVYVPGEAERRIASIPIVQRAAAAALQDAWELA
jgi:hypothetical protein